MLLVKYLHVTRRGPRYRSRANELARNADYLLFSLAHRDGPVVVGVGGVDEQVDLRVAELVSEPPHDLRQFLPVHLKSPPAGHVGTKNRPRGEGWQARKHRCYYCWMEASERSLCENSICYTYLAFAGCFPGRNGLGSLFTHKYGFRRTVGTECIKWFWLQRLISVKQTPPLKVAAWGP